MPATVSGIHLSGTHAARPAANTVPDGSLYSCTTDSLIYKSNYAGNSWSTWATLGGTAGAAPLDSAGSGSGDSRNDEFAGGPGLDPKWTLVGTTPDSVDVNSTLAGMLYLRRNDTGSLLTAYYQGSPSPPFDVYAKLRASTFAANFARGGGILLLPSSPTPGSVAHYWGSVYNGGRQLSSILYSPNLSSFGGETTAGVVAMPLGAWLRVRVVSTTSVETYYSLDGIFWVQHQAAFNPGITVANIGLAFAPEGQATDLEAAFEFFRVAT